MQPKKMDTKSRDQPLHVPGLKYYTKEMFDLFIIVEEAYRAEVLLVFKKKNISKLLHGTFIIHEIINSYTLSTKQLKLTFLY
jgi:hypothetical protein